jgi:hypothetical protein
MPKDKKPTIRYTARDFTSIRQDLINYVKRYYPESYKDFNQSSFGSLMIDTVSYIGDQLSFYLDYQINESFLDSAQEYGNIMRHGQRLGYKAMGGASTPYGTVTLFVLVPAKTNGLGPDTSYIPVLQEGSTFMAGSTSFILQEDIDFSKSTNEIVAARMDTTTGVPTYYAIKAHGQVMGGKYRTATHTVGASQRFLNVPINDKNIQEVISVRDTAGNEYFEVDYLSQNVVYKAFTNPNADGLSTKSILKPITVPRRFTTMLDPGGKMILQFGFGSESEQTNASVADPTDVVVSLHGRTHIKDTAFDPAKLLKTDKFGIAPENTTLTIQYRSLQTGITGVSVGGINKVGKARWRFTGIRGLSVTKVADVKKSLEVFNEDPITGGGTAARMTEQELRTKIFNVYATQNRCVTQQDYEAMVYNMPDKFGSISRCRIIRDDDSFKRNLNLYVISEHPNGGMTTTSDVVKENLKVWLNKNKMINDTIDILDGKVVNLGIEYKIKADTETSKMELLSKCSSAIRTNLLSTKFHIGESLHISSIYSMLNRIDGVVDVIDVKVVKKIGNAYSDIRFNIDKNMTADRRYISCPKNVVFEIKYPRQDIKGTII